MMSWALSPQVYMTLVANRGSALATLVILVMTLYSILLSGFSTSILLKLLAVVTCVLLLRELLSYVRMRIALRSVSTIPGPPAESIFSGRPVQPPSAINDLTSLC